MNTDKYVLITGGAGFIGSHLVSRLVDTNEIVVYDNLHRNALQFAHLDGHPRLHFIRGDVLDYDATRKAIEGCQVVIHCAAIAGVYTPSAFRNRGYASAVTAAVVDSVFAEGRTMACLYTDLRNPASNRCYAKIGFKPACRSWYYPRAQI